MSTYLPRWHSKPPSAWPLNHGHPRGGQLDAWLASTCAGQILSSGLYGTVGTLNSSVTWVGHDRLGTMMNFASGGAVTTSSGLYNWERTQPWSVSFWIYPTTLGSAERCFISTLDPANNYKGWEVSLETNNTLRAFAINSFPSNATKASTTTTLSVNTLYHVVVTYNGGSTSASFNFYLNGALLSQTASGVDALSATIVSTIPLRMGNRSNGTIPYVGQMSDIGIWPRVLSADDARSLYLDPWQSYMPHPAWGILPTASGLTNYTLACAGETATGVGQAASLLASRRLTLAAETATGAGQAATLKATRLLTLAGETATGAGQAATLRLVRRLTLAAETATGAGIAATYQLARYLSLAGGTATGVGRSATLNYSNAPQVTYPDPTRARWERGGPDPSQGYFTR